MQKDNNPKICSRKLGKKLNFLNRLKKKQPLFGQGWVYKKRKRTRNGARHIFKKLKKVEVQI